MSILEDGFNKAGNRITKAFSVIMGKDKAKDKSKDKSIRPQQSTQESAEAFYMNLWNLATLAHAISGGIESPIQFCIQVYIQYNLKHIESYISSFKILIDSGT